MSSVEQMPGLNQERGTEERVDGATGRSEVSQSWLLKEYFYFEPCKYITFQESKI